MQVGKLHSEIRIISMIFHTLKAELTPLSSFFFIYNLSSLYILSSFFLSFFLLRLRLSFVQDAKVKEQDDAQIATKKAAKNPLFTALAEGKKLNIFGRDDQETSCDKCLTKWESGNKPNGYVLEY